LTRGGGADLIDLDNGELLWRNLEDPDFQGEFPAFLDYQDTADILEYLEEVGELTGKEADDCQIVEEFLTPADLAGMLRVPT